MVRSSVTRRPSTLRGSMPSPRKVSSICGPPPCTTIGFMPTYFISTTSRTKLSWSVSSVMALPPYLITNVLP